ncbi:hypothetical protein NDU88_004330 [Pleurodeles waltl]|uniref:Uncharacterized protein n=1 Tax=Pleurodeles waltl TaxID=8319 RepID=A0AAV7W8Q9_PLEWA|nr:hypothetical protein NDU88_004330 [Pleurodeles waltl]
MGTPTDTCEANFRSPALKAKTDSGKEGEEFSWRTPRREDVKETPRPEKKESDHPQVLERREEGGSQTPEMSTCRHDPGGSWPGTTPYCL